MVNKITSCKAYHGFAGGVPLISFSRCKDTTSQEPRVRECPPTSVNVRETRKTNESLVPKILAAY
jgi:hypothetical protein